MIRGIPPPEADGQIGWQVLKALIHERSLLAAMEAMHARVGDVFRITLPGFCPVVLADPAANRSVLVTQRNRFRWRSESDPVTRLLHHGLLVEDGESHRHLREQMEPVLRRAQVMAQIEAMRHYTAATTATWRDGSTYDMLVEMRRVALVIVMGTLFGVEFAPDMDRLWPAILRLLDYISPGLWIMWPEIPRPGYARAIREMDAYLYHIIRARHAHRHDADDLLSRLVNTPGMSDELIRDQLLTMLIAGHDTSTALLSWTLYLLGCHPLVMARARAEVDAVLGAGPPTAEQLRKLRFMDQVIKETLRLYPPIHVGNRMAADDVQVEGYDITAGTRVMISIYLAHRHPSYWHTPEQFYPERFDPQQRCSPPSFTYLPFGGGPRNCIGAAFAQVEAKVVLAHLLQTFELQLVSTRVRPYMGATLEPRPGVLMQVTRRRKRDG